MEKLMFYKMLFPRKPRLILKLFKAGEQFNGYSKGTKGEHPSMRVVPRTRFTILFITDETVTRFIG
jgi:hypothetical protein